MKYIFTLIICFGFISISSSFGQEETKKVVIVKKTIDASGQEIVQREEASGKEADALIKKMKEDGDLEGIDIEVEIEKSKKSGSSKKEKLEDVSIEKSIVNGKEVTSYKIVTEENGEKKVMVWKGDGEMPAEMAEKLKHLDIKTESFDINDEKTMRITIDTGEHDEDSDIHESHEKRIYFSEENKNKVTLGIMIEDDSQGVVVSDIVADSVAKNIGLKSGDTIVKINDGYVFNTDMLLKALSKFDKGDSALVTYLRDGKENTVRAAF